MFMPRKPAVAPPIPDLSAIQPGDEITVRVRVTSTLPGDIPLFNVGGEIDQVEGQRPYWLNAGQVVSHEAKS